MPEETETSVIFRIKAEVKTEKLIELSLLYENKAGRSLKLDQLFVLSEIVKRGKVTLAELAETPNISNIVYRPYWTTCKNWDSSSQQVKLLV